MDCSRCQANHSLVASAITARAGLCAGLELDSDKPGFQLRSRVTAKSNAAEDLNSGCRTRYDSVQAIPMNGDLKHLVVLSITVPSPGSRDWKRPGFPGDRTITLQVVPGTRSIRNFALLITPESYHACRFV